MKALEEETGTHRAVVTPVVYVVEDEPALLELAHLTLSTGPWRVRTFGDPSKALRCFEEEKPERALLLTDYAMSPINGLELATRCKEIDPHLKVVMMSGTARVDITTTGSVLDAFLPKPFYPKELLGLLRSVLGI